MEKPNKTQEISQFFQENMLEKDKKLEKWKIYVQDLVTGKIIAPDTKTQYPLNYIFWEITGNVEENIAYDFLLFYVEELKKKQDKRYWNEYICLPYYSYFLIKYPNNRTVLLKLLALFSQEEIPLPANYWYWCYENPQFYFELSQLSQYPPILDALIKAIEAQKGKSTLKNAEIERISGFKRLVENVSQNPIYQNNLFFEQESFSIKEFYLPFIQISVENNYKKENLLQDAENLLLLLAVLGYYGNETRLDARQPIPFQELTAEKITLNEFLGIDIEKLKEKNKQKNNEKSIFEKLGEVDLSKFEQNGMIYHLFQHPYAPNLKHAKIDFIPENLKKESEKKTFFLQNLIQNLLLLDIESPENTEYQEIWSISTNTSHYFDAGNEWFGAKFWAIHHKIENKVSFLLSSFTD
ncbi:MAG: hypothetical protein EAZ85_06595 [Bacteroidetes bacterium]|nr:MAG: hypothetical protein EAZ85_06595 [Bacteroidota bacterium]TAG87570.1 MAG: hypothetical protein EAZ20_10395 [Bacteroidota bacterium]